MSDLSYRKLKNALSCYGAAAKLSGGDPDVKFSIDAMQDGVQFITSQEAVDAMISIILGEGYKTDFNFTALPVWTKKIAYIVHNYCTTTLKLLESSNFSHRIESEANAEADALTKTYLIGLRYWAPFVAAYAAKPKIAGIKNRSSLSHDQDRSILIEKLYQRVLAIWATASKSVSLFAYSALETVITAKCEQLPSMPQAPASLKQYIFKNIFTAHVRNLKSQMNPYTLKSLSFQRQCIKALYLLDEDVGYPVCFTFVRQLGTYMRNSIHDATSDGKHRDSVKATRKKNKQEGIKTTNLNVNTNKALKAVLSWRYFGSIQVWIELASSDSKVYEQLIYPLVSIVQGLVNLAPNTITLAPLYLHCATLLNALSLNKNVFIPVLMPLFQLLNSSEITSAPGPAPKTFRRQATGLVDTSCVLRAGPTLAQTQLYRDTIVHDALYATKEFALANLHSLGYPELVTPIVKELLTLHKTLAGSQHGIHRAWARMYKKTAQLLEESTKDIVSKRSALEFGPNDIEKVSAFENQLRSVVWADLNSESPKNSLIKEVQDIRKFTQRTITIAADGVVGDELEEVSESQPDEDVIPKKMKLKEAELEELLDNNSEDNEDEELVDNEDDLLEELSLSSE